MELNSLLHIRKARQACLQPPLSLVPQNDTEQVGPDDKWHEQWVIFIIKYSLLDYIQAVLYPKERWDRKGREVKGKYPWGSLPWDREPLQDREVTYTLLPPCSKDDHGT